MENRSTRNGVIDFWKFIFSVLVMLHHSYHLKSGIVPMFRGGTIGVEFFFIVSGFLMVRSAIAQGEEIAPGSLGLRTHQFVSRKFLRLLPQIIIGWCITFVVVAVFERTGPAKLVTDAIHGAWQLLAIYHYGIDGFVFNWPLWYIFALLVAMLMLYPLLLKNRGMFLYVWAPLIAIFCFGYMYKNFFTLRNPGTWLGLCYAGLVRGLAGVSLGAVCFRLCEGLSRVRFSMPGRLLLTLVENGCYLTVVFATNADIEPFWDFYMAPMLAVAVVISFSGQSLSGRLISAGFGRRLGNFGFALYLSHICWAAQLGRVLGYLSYGQLLPVYICASAANAALLLLLTRLWEKCRPAVQGGLRRIILDNSHT